MRKIPNFLAGHYNFLIMLLVVLGLIFLRYEKGIVQQDNYIGYSETLFDRLPCFATYETRLFPGLPMVIGLVRVFIHDAIWSGYLVMIGCLVGSYGILYKLTGSKYSFLPLIFPPIMLNQTTIIATEPLMIFLMLASIYGLTRWRKRKFVAFFFLGLSCTVRLVGGVIFLGVLAWLGRKNLKKSLAWLGFFIFPIILFGLYNSFRFGREAVFCPLATYGGLTPINLGFLQLIKDIPRAFNWGWYRILFSGISYFALLCLLLVLTIKELRRRGSSLGRLVFDMILAVLFFVFLLGPVPFLEEYARYLSPTFPLFWIVLRKRFTGAVLAYFLLAISVVVVLL